MSRHWDVVSFVDGLVIFVVGPWGNSALQHMQCLVNTGFDLVLWVRAIINQIVLR